MSAGVLYDQEMALRESDQARDDAVHPLAVLCQ